MNEVWGKGIPNYKQEDIMNDQDIHDLVIRALCNDLVSQGFEIGKVILDVRMLPNIFAKKNNKIYAIVVKSSVYPNQKGLEYSNQVNLIKYCESNNMIPVYIGGFISSIDNKRMSECLALKEDSFNIDTTGLKEIKTNYELGTIEYFSNLLYELGKAIENKNIDKLKNIFDLEYNYLELINLFLKSKVRTELIEFENKTLGLLIESNNKLFTCSTKLNELYKIIDLNIKEVKEYNYKIYCERYNDLTE